MNTPSPDIPAFRSKNLLGILSFLKPYWIGATLAVTLLLFNIALEMFLPRIWGSAINQLRYSRRD